MDCKCSGKAQGGFTGGKTLPVSECRLQLAGLLRFCFMLVYHSESQTGSFKDAQSNKARHVSPCFARQPRRAPGGCFVPCCRAVQGWRACADCQPQSPQWLHSVGNSCNSFKAVHCNMKSALAGHHHMLLVTRCLTGYGETLPSLRGRVLPEPLQFPALPLIQLPRHGSH